MAFYGSRRRAEEPRNMASKSQNVTLEELDVVTLNRVHALDEEELEKLYMWVDEIPLSRQKRNMARDFADGVLAAEVVKFFLPRLVDLHNYTPTSSNHLKADNWFHFNRKVLVRMNTEISRDVIQAICACKPNVIESVLCILRDKIDIYLAKQKHRSTGRRDFGQDVRPEADQDRGYIPSAEGFYQDGQQPQTRRFINQEYNVGLESLPFYSPQGKTQQPTQPQGNLSGRGPAKQEMVPKTFLDEREKAIDAREQTIQMLSGKIQRLEQLLRLKDMRVEDLTQKLDHLVQPSFPKGTNHRLQGGNRHPLGRY